MAPIKHFAAQSSSWGPLQQCCLIPCNSFTVCILMSRWSRCRGFIAGCTRSADLTGRLALVRRLFLRRWWWERPV